MKFGLSNKDYEFLRETLFFPLLSLGAKIFVFGSRARGTQHQFSDIDILFIEDPKRPLAEGKVSELREKLEDSNLTIKVDLVDAKSLAKSYRQNIDNDKVEITLETSGRKNQSDRKKSKVHAWRLCPLGQHWVRSHPMHTQPSKTHPAGSVTIRHGHCAANPSGKDHLYPDEIGEIAKSQFDKLKEMPCPDGLGFKQKGKSYDSLIAGWTKYWNDVLTPCIPLDPNTVKALIASESGFDPKARANKNDPGSARGLMQITNNTRKILGDEKGELKDHYLNVTTEELNDPNTNICAGIRWLFQKQKLASINLGHNATWDETIMDYKGTRGKNAGTKSKLFKDFQKYKKILDECKIP